MAQPGKPLLASRSTRCVVPRVRDVLSPISALGKLNPIAGIGSKAGKRVLLPGLTPPIPTGKNYWVHYWDPNWQHVISRYLDAIISAGFDGVYLDRIDAYQESYAAGHENDMVRFVTNIAHYARTHSPLGEDFGIIVQNAEELAAHHPDYVRLVTGIGREEVYVQATNRPTSQSARAQTEKYLDLFHQNSLGKLVLTVDYANRTDLVCTTYERARAKAYIPYVTNVDLDRLQMNSYYEPGSQGL